MKYKLKIWCFLSLVIISRNADSQISLKLVNADGNRIEIPIDSVSYISHSSLNKKALNAICYPDILEREFTGYSGTVQYDFTFTSEKMVDAKLVNGFSTLRDQHLFGTEKADDTDSVLFKEHERVFNKVKKYLRLKEGIIYVMRIPIKFEWDENNHKSIKGRIY